MPVSPLGILGGTYDPVHIGHLRLAIEIVERFALSELRLIPVGTPNLRAAPVLSAGQRLEMLHAAVRDIPVLAVDDREVRRGGVSYTVETLASLRDEFGGRPLLFVLGMDAFRGFPRWERWREVLNITNLVVVTRPGATLPRSDELMELLAEAQTEDPQEFLASQNGRVMLQPIPLLPVSSTDIRERLGSGGNVRFLIPDAVHEIIIDHGFYTTGAE